MQNDAGVQRGDPQLTSTGRFFAQGTNGFQPGELGLSVGALASRKPQPSTHGIKAKILDELFSQEAAGGNVSDNGRFEAQARAPSPPLRALTLPDPAHPTLIGAGVLCQDSTLRGPLPYHYRCPEYPRAAAAAEECCCFMRARRIPKRLVEMHPGQ